MISLIASPATGDFNSRGFLHRYLAPLLAGLLLATPAFLAAQEVDKGKKPPKEPTGPVTMEQLAERLVDLEARSEKLTAKQAQLQEDLDQIPGQTAQLADRLAKHDAKQAKLAAQIQQGEADLAALQDEADELRAKTIKGKSTELDKVLAKIAKQEAALADLTTEAANAAAELADIQARAENLPVRAQELAAKLVEIEAKLARIADRIERITARLANWDDDEGGDKGKGKGKDKDKTDDKKGQTAGGEPATEDDPDV